MGRTKNKPKTQHAQVHASAAIGVQRQAHRSEEKVSAEFCIVHMFQNCQAGPSEQMFGNVALAITPSHIHFAVWQTENEEHCNRSAELLSEVLSKETKQLKATPHVFTSFKLLP